MTKSKTNRVIGYLRVSTTKQGILGLGIEGQEAAIAAYVAKEGCKLVATYREVESGRKNDRPQLALALEHARRVRATLVIAKLDRLARSVHFVSGLMESKVPFVCCDQPMANDFTIHIFAAAAQQEAKATSERTKAGLDALKARGYWSTKKNRVVTLGSPQNLKTEKALAKAKDARERGLATIQRNTASAYDDIRPRILEMQAQEMSLRAIARALNDDDEQTRHGKAWNAAQVARVIRMEVKPAEQPLPFHGAAA